MVNTAIPAVVQTTVEVRVMRLRIHLAKVSWPGGHQLVAGGRLVSSVKDGVSTPTPDLPEYDITQFPVDFIRWSDGLEPGVTVEMLGNGGTMRAVSCVRACTLLFAACPVDEVRAWIKGGGK